MKRILTALAVSLVLAGTAQAQHRHHGHVVRAQHGHHGHHGGWSWGPVVGGAILGAVVYDIYNRPIQAQPAPVIVQPAPQPSQVVQCPIGTYPFEQRGWVRNQYNQYIQTTYIECK